MGRDFAQGFYNSKAWKDCREAYKKEKHYLCERCLAKGLFTPGEIVHHRIHITPANVSDPDVLLNFDNLELLCRQCHAEEHRPLNRDRRYIIDDDGRIIIKNEKFVGKK